MATAAAASCDVAHLLSMSDDQKLEMGKAVLAAALKRELSLSAAVGAGNNYEKSFGGTKRDTQVMPSYHTHPYERVLDGVWGGALFQLMMERQRLHSIVVDFVVELKKKCKVKQFAKRQNELELSSKSYRGVSCFAP